jgi:GNAT superfamily N-acetyltransferase
MALAPWEPLSQHGAMTVTHGSDVATLDAAALVVRPVDPADADRLRAFYADLSPDSRRLRFLGSSGDIGAAGSRAFCTPDHLHAEGFVAELSVPPGDAVPRASRTHTGTDVRAHLGAGMVEDPPAILAHLCLEPDGSGGTEFAIAVADAWQGRGVGRRLMEHALGWAEEHGIGSLDATALATNTGVQRLVRAVAPEAIIRGLAGGVVEITILIGRDVPSGPSEGAVVPITGRRWRAILGA